VDFWLVLWTVRSMYLGLCWRWDIFLSEACVALVRVHISLQLNEPPLCKLEPLHAMERWCLISSIILDFEFSGILVGYLDGWINVSRPVLEMGLLQNLSR
jgi:hypothetical protein